MGDNTKNAVTPVAGEGNSHQNAVSKKESVHQVEILQDYNAHEIWHTADEIMNFIAVECLGGDRSDAFEWYVFMRSLRDSFAQANGFPPMGTRKPSVNVNVFMNAQIQEGGQNASI
jgi:hypothetical protein